MTKCGIISLRYCDIHGGINHMNQFKYFKIIQISILAVLSLISIFVLFRPSVKQYVFSETPATVLFFLVWIQIGRILAAGWVFYWFLSEFSFSRQSKFIFSFAYGLSGYLLVWGQHYQFGMVTVYFPLLLLFCE